MLSVECCHVVSEGLWYGSGSSQLRKEMRDQKVLFEGGCSERRHALYRWFTRRREKMKEVKTRGVMMICGTC